MQKEHRDAIQKNFSSLVAQTDLDLMVAALYEKGVFSDPMIEPYKDTSKNAHTRKQLLYREITRRGPDAFGHLLDTLSENGYWNLVRVLDPNSPLHTRNTRSNQNQSEESSFLSLSGTRKKTATGKEQTDPNRNWAGQSTSRGSSQQKVIRTELEHNGNPPPAEHIRLGESLDQKPNIPQFNVIKSTAFFEDDGKDIKLYRTRGRRRGAMLLFSYEVYAAGIEDARHGAEVDADNLRYLFSELGFRVGTYLNLSLQDTKAALSSLNEGICSERPETVFVVFSSHGYQRAGSGDSDIRCSDGALISFFDIIEYFNNERLPALAHVPKVFIFQTCRGTNKDSISRAPRHLLPPPGRARSAPDGGPVPDGSTPYSDDEPANGDASGNRLYSDILIAHSTVPGFVSYRDPERGSWYISTLCAVFAARAHDSHVEDLFTMVDQRLDTTYSSQTSSVDRWGFNKRLYLHPGLYED